MFISLFIVDIVQSLRGSTRGSYRPSVLDFALAESCSSVRRTKRIGSAVSIDARLRLSVSASICDTLNIESAPAVRRISYIVNLHFYREQQSA